MSRWYRAYVGTVSDPKIAGVAHRAGVSKCIAIAIWHFLLERAADANNGGSYRTDGHEICAALDIPMEQTEAVLRAMIAVEMIDKAHITAWKTRQYESDSSTDRVKKWRAKKGCNGDETLQNETETSPSVSVSVLSSSTLENEFEKFWKAYPKRDGSNPRKPAFDKFCRLIRSGVPPNKIVSGLLGYSAECERKKLIGTDKVAQAITWLNQERFNDYFRPEDAETRRKADEFMALKGWVWNGEKYVSGAAA